MSFNIYTQVQIKLSFLHKYTNMHTHFSSIHSISLSRTHMFSKLAQPYTLTLYPCTHCLSPAALTHSVIHIHTLTHKLFTHSLFLSPTLFTHCVFLLHTFFIHSRFLSHTLFIHSLCHSHAHTFHPLTHKHIHTHSFHPLSFFSLTQTTFTDSLSLADIFACLPGERDD